MATRKHNNPPDLLQFVRAELERRRGDIRQIAQDTGLSYDTCLRIKNREGDPGYTKVQVLAEYLSRVPA
jgi:DNA-binding phage protein